MTAFNIEMKTEKGDVIIILMNFDREKYRGGDVFRVGDSTKVVVNDDNYKCTEKLKEW